MFDMTKAAFKVIGLFLICIATLKLQVASAQEYGKQRLQSPTEFCPDLRDMNIKGNVSRLTERSYYTGEGLSREAVEGGLFDDASFLSLVYSDEHIARVFYKKWFLSQVSDCEIQFDEYGNILMIKSLWEDGGEVHFIYDRRHILAEMDGRNPAGNQDEGLVLYHYRTSNGRIVAETMIHEEDNQLDTSSVKYHYDANNHLSRAVMSTESNNYFFSYLDGRLYSVYLKDFWRDGVSVSYKIEYNSNGDIMKVSSTGKKGDSSSARETTFEYKYDFNNNWTERIGRVVLLSGEEYQIETIRSYDYR